MDFDLNKRYCYYFNEISKIPRGSRNEKAVSDYIVGFANGHGLSYKQDEVFNVLISKPASAGYEDAETVVMQAHIDMVCEKNNDVVHDFEKDPLDLYVEDGWLHARGTTLGADDGQGVAYMLAILEDDTLKHPKLQCIFTSMEEIGLLGACALKKEDIHGKQMINLDGGGEVVTCVSSSGGARAKITKPVTFEKNDKNTYRLSVRGLLGGHSASRIHLERGNSNIIAARILREAQAAGIVLQIADFRGGLKFNAIPREADVLFASDSSKAELEEVLKPVIGNIRSELEFSDPGLHVSLYEEPKADAVLTQKDTDDILNMMYVMPNGFQHKSLAIEGLTVASLNAGVAYFENGLFTIDNLIRSAAASHTDQMILQIRIIGKAFGFDIRVNDRYGGWAYSADSRLREILKGVLKDKGIEMKERATHGGLECGIFKALVPEMDIITYGPVSEGEHTPDEKLDLASFDRAYENLCELLKRCG